MEIEFADDALRRLATDSSELGGLPKHVADKYRDRVAYIQAAPNEQALRALQGSLDFKKRKGCADNEKSMRLNQQYRIHLQTIDRGGERVIRITGVGDFHD